MSSRSTIEASVEDRGFTLIELIVVMLVIGVLASIAIPTMLRQRHRAWRSSTQTDLSNFAVAAESAAVEGGGSFARVFLVATVGDPLVSGGVLQAGAVQPGFDFRGTQTVDLTLGAPASSASFCVVGHNSALGDSSGWMTYSKAKGGLQVTEWTSRDLAEAAC